MRQRFQQEQARLVLVCLSRLNFRAAFSTVLIFVPPKKQIKACGGSMNVIIDGCSPIATSRPPLSSKIRNTFNMNSLKSVLLKSQQILGKLISSIWVLGLAILAAETPAQAFFRCIGHGSNVMRGSKTKRLASSHRSPYL